MSETIVGTSVPRLDGSAKVTGQARYADDITVPGMLHAATVRSPHAHARILSIDVAPALAMPDVLAAITAADIPGSNGLGPVVKDQPVLAADVVLHAGEPVAIVAAETREAAEQAAAAVKVAYEPLPALTDPETALADGAISLHPSGNVATRTRLRKGDVEAGFAASDVIVEGDFSTQFVEHAPIEPECAVASLEADGSILVQTATQYVHFDRDEIARTLALPPSRVRVIQLTTGGGFGGKFGSPLPQCHAALLAAKTRRPVKVTWSRSESITTSSKRHPYRMHLRVGARSDGMLQAVEAALVSDTGAYLLTGNSVMGKSTTHCTGPYAVPHVKVEGTVVFTNNLPAGAMRGYGVPQVAVAIEQMLTRLADRLEMDPVDLRLRNALDIGHSTATGQVLTGSVGIREALRQAGDAARDFRQEVGGARPGCRRGVGVAASWHGTCGARAPSEGVAIIHLGRSGSVSVVCGAVDIGQGSNTVLAQIAAEELRVPVDHVRVISDDSAVTPDCEATTASRVTYTSGNACRLAGIDARRQILEIAAEDLEISVDDLELQDGVVSVRGVPGRSRTIGELMRSRRRQEITAVGAFVPPVTPLDPETMQGAPHAAYGLGAHAALVEVEMDTGKVQVLRYAAFNDVGRAINPAGVVGQSIGGAVMGIGYGLFEGVRLCDGHVLTPNLATYLLPTALDVPRVDVGIIEAPEATGPYGAKGVGELASNPVAPTILAAIHDATGVLITDTPATPERVFAAIRTPEAAISPTTRPDGSPDGATPVMG